MPREHGIVGNGWYFRETGEIRFWQQSNRLMHGHNLVEDFQTAKMFWWFNQGAPVTWFATPKPYYGCDGSKAFGILDQTQCALTDNLGPFPFFNFWGPKAGLPSSEWIAQASALVMRKHRPQLTLVYLPHLDYDFQRFSEQDPQRIAEVDACAGQVIDAAVEIGAQVVVVSEYGLVPVSRPVLINRALRQAGLLVVRDGPFGEVLMPMDSRAFAVADHQLAHVYINDPSAVNEVRRVLEDLPGLAALVEPGDLQLDHPRSGELIALSEPDAWFAYYYWLDDARARTLPHGGYPPQTGIRSLRAVHDITPTGGGPIDAEETRHALPHGCYPARSSIGTRQPWLATRRRARAGNPRTWRPARAHARL